MSTGLFIVGLLAWLFDEPNIGCLLLALAWLLHEGSPDDDDGARAPVTRRPAEGTR